VMGKHNYDYKSRDFGSTYALLLEEEKGAHDKLWAFVKAFEPALVTDKKGKPVLDTEGEPVTEPHFINTHNLVVSVTPYFY